MFDSNFDGNFHDRNLDRITKIDVISFLGVNGYFDTNLDNNFNPGLDTTIFVPNFYKFDHNFGNFDDRIDSFNVGFNFEGTGEIYRGNCLLEQYSELHSELDLSQIDFVHVVTPSTRKDMHMFCNFVI